MLCQIRSKGPGKNENFGTDLTAGLAAVAVAGLPFLIVRYTTESVTGGWVKDSLHAWEFWPVYALWLLLVFVFTFLGIDLQLRSTSSEIQGVGKRVSEQVESSAGDFVKRKAELRQDSGRLILRTGMALAASRRLREWSRPVGQVLRGLSLVTVAK
jgi:hypothetical protein